MFVRENLLALLYLFILLLRIPFKLIMNNCTKQEIKIIFDGLSEEREITLRPVEAFHTTFHAALTDKFGVSWNIVAEELPKSE